MIASQHTHISRFGVSSWDELAHAMHKSMEMDQVEHKKAENDAVDGDRSTITNNCFKAAVRFVISLRRGCALSFLSLIDFPSRVNRMPYAG